VGYKIPRNTVVLTVIPGRHCPATVNTFHDYCPTVVHAEKMLKHVVRLTFRGYPFLSTISDFSIYVDTRRT
jgi:hypothetical protein